jgi:sulfatase-like protein
MTVETRTGAPPASRARAIASTAVTVAAIALVLAFLIVPGELDHVSVFTALRIPVEGLLGLALVLAVPVRVRTVVATVLGVLLGLWGVVRIVDVGFFATLDRPFDPVLDWSFVSSGVTVLTGSMGRARTAGVVLAAIIAALGLIVVTALAAVRASRFAARHARHSSYAIAALAVVWVVCAVTGARVVADEPIAARDFLDRVGHVPTSIKDSGVFAASVTTDAFRDTPPDDLLTGLRGKDVLVVLVESYGRVAVESPEIAPHVGEVLADGTQRLAAAGFGSRSAFVTSPTVGGGSWLASSTLLSGVWVANQQRYEYLADTDRLSLPGAFRKAGWHTIALMPGLNDPWPEGHFYGYDEIHGSKQLGYAGPVYSFDSIPDQYTLSYFQRQRGQGPPVMAVVPLISSHAPWAPVPDLMDWSQIGDGASYPRPTESLNPAEIILQRDVSRVRADYAHAIGYTLSSLVSYVQTYGDDDLVVLFVGDHQPAPVVIGDTENHDTPISIVARDPAVLDRIASWGWTAGLRPDASSPVWLMDEVRDRFLAAFS